MFKEVMVYKFFKLMTGPKLQIQKSESTNHSKYEKTNKNFQTQLYDIQTDKNRNKMGVITNGRPEIKKKHQRIL